MGIRSSTEFGEQYSRFDAAAAEDTLRELDEQFAAGEIEAHAYFEKKQSLVRLFLKATTNPRRIRRAENYDGA
ncbi:hypothetical protein [Leucobacter luti]|uniref:Uncharacterized protein n=1 Tax=Leucobacter luti TaxID=340320 RepID=A0A4R6S1N3_9MICO|nr:hypothetical protein [Leucobacter luti]MCW2289430.1 hypothetical protein [Leucobacter luti]QYM74802.1 hypothetical protein K1X41_08635 [Leucobacter luti]TCK39989.1 hypothetical protein EDF60_2449 [Leucobacter luti]TDP93153.1 hypothetical protein EDF62_1129 [Leucobacter luti]